MGIMSLCMNYFKFTYSKKNKRPNKNAVFMFIKIELIQI